MAFLLESNENDTRLARYSFMGVSPMKTFLFKNGQATLQDNRKETLEQLPVGNPMSIIRQLMDETKHRFENTQDKADFALPFTGGLVGYMGYGATRYFEGIPQQSFDPLDVPEGYYGLYDSVIVFDHLHRRLFFVSHAEDAEAQAFWSRLEKKLTRATPLIPLPCNFQDVPDELIFEAVSSSFTKQDFCNRVLQAKELIRKGELFQIVLAQRFSLPVKASPMSIYRMLRAVNPSPYSYYLKFPGFTYLGTSPETFASCQSGRLELRVLAGTRPRGATEEEDRHLEQELLQDEKEMAEHRMLVDLGRNDLGKVCKPGTIHVGRIATLTRYTHVMHLATRLTGTLRQDKTTYEAFQGCFPRGTVSGAPKIRAMQRLAKLEPECRGIYSGAVGYFDHAGGVDSAIAIRSVLIKNNQAHVNAGAGIVHDSDPQSEYQETRNKAKSILKSIQLAERLAHYDRIAHR